MGPRLKWRIQVQGSSWLRCSRAKGTRDSYTWRPTLNPRLHSSSESDAASQNALKFLEGVLPKMCYLQQ